MSLEHYNGPQLEDVTSPPGNLEERPAEEAVDAIKEWFFENFEDPAHNTPHDSGEGGYIYIWGGPYETADILESAFGGEINNEIINAAISEIEHEGGPYWTTADRRILPPEDDYPTVSGSFLHKQMLERIADLEKALKGLQTSSAPGIGHNNPPEPIEESYLASSEINNIIININILKSQPTDATIDKRRASEAVSHLETAWDKLKSSLAAKGNLFLDNFLESAGEELGKRTVQAAYACLVLNGLTEVIDIAKHWIAASH